MMINNSLLNSSGMLFCSRSAQHILCKTSWIFEAQSGTCFCNLNTVWCNASWSKFWSRVLVKNVGQTWIKWSTDLQLPWVSEGEQNSQCTSLNPFMYYVLMSSWNFLPLLFSVNHVVETYCSTKMPLLIMRFSPLIWFDITMFIYL